MRRVLLAALVLSLVTGACTLLSAAELLWDGDGTLPLGGSGTWNSTLPNWYTGSGYQAWNNSALDDARFGTTGGTVSMASSAVVHNITFDVPGYTLSGYTISLGGAAPTITTAPDVTATIAANITGTAGMTKSGAGMLVLNSSSYYSGTTTVSEGVLRLRSGNSLPGGIGSSGGTSNLTLAGGVLEIPADTFFRRSLGTSQSQVQFTGSGGFSAWTPYVSKNPPAVTVALGWNALTWGSGSFIPNGSEFILSSPWANATVDFQNSIDLGNSLRTVRVENGTAETDANLSGTLTGSDGGLCKTGAGTLQLRASNTYTGPTVVADGVLELGTPTALPGGISTTGGVSNLTLAGGAVALPAFTSPSPLGPAPTVFSRSLGTAADQVQFVGSGGFQVVRSAVNISQATYPPTAVVVDLGGSGAPVAWNSGGFVPDGASLILGSTGTVPLNIGIGLVLVPVALDFSNPIDLGPSIRTVNAPQGLARLTGVLSGAGGLAKTGPGTLELSAANSYTGPTIINEGILRLGHADAIPGGVGATGGTSNLLVSSGVIDLAAGNFYRALGTGPDQVQFAGSGGFSGFATLVQVPSQLIQQPRVVNLGGQSAQVIWGSGGFISDGSTFILASSAIGASVDFQNPIDLGTLQRTIQCDGQSLYPDNPPYTPYMTGILSGELTGTGSFVKTGIGILKLAARNTYTGETQVTEGVLQLGHTEAIPGGIGRTGGTSHLAISGGATLILDSGEFQRNLGPGPGEVQFSGSGGFSGGSSHIVNFGGAGASVSWNANPYLPDDFTLVLGNRESHGPMDLRNPLVLGPGKRSISVTYGTGDTHARLSGNITGDGGLKKTGGLVLDLANANTYSGETEVSSGVLRLSHPNALPGGTAATGGISNLNFTGSNNRSTRGTDTFVYSTTHSSIVELAVGDFTRSLGTGGDQVQFTGSGGFSAYGADRVVNLGGASQTLVWGEARFVPTGMSLCLSSRYANATVDFQNPIDLGSAARTIQVDDGTADVDARLSGILSGTGGLGKSGSGTLELPGENTYTGQTVIGDGALRLSHPKALPGGTGVTGGKSNLCFGGDVYYGVIELASGDFTRGLGTGPDQVQFGTYESGGFAAVGADRIVNLGGASATVTCKQDYFSGLLNLGSLTADAMVDFQNPVVIGSSTTTFAVDTRNGAAPIDATISGMISGSGRFEKSGDGALRLTSACTFLGSTSIRGGTLLVDGSLDPQSQVTVWWGATLGGTGSVGPVAVYADCHIAPGDFVGTLTIVGDLTLYTGALLDFDLAGALDSDLLSLSQTLVLNDQQFSDFTFTPLDGFGPGVYRLIDAGTTSGDLGANRSGMIGDFSATLSTSGGDLLLTVVPEPSSIVLAAIALSAILTLARRRSRPRR